MGGRRRATALIRRLRADLDARRVRYVPAISCHRRVPTAAGPVGGRHPRRRSTLGRLAVALGWACQPRGSATTTGVLITLTNESGHSWLLIRRHPRHGKLAFYRCYFPTPLRLGALSALPDTDGPIDESFGAGKGPGRLGEHQVRGPLLAGMAALDPAHDARPCRTRGGRHHPTANPPSRPGLIVLTSNEIQHLSTELIAEPNRRLTCPPPGRLHVEAGPNGVSSVAREQVDR